MHPTNINNTNPHILIVEKTPGTCYKSPIMPKFTSNESNPGSQLTLLKQKVKKKRARQKQENDQVRIEENKRRRTEETNLLPSAMSSSTTNSSGGHR